MEKYALILHGWPGGRTGNFFLTEYLREKGYKVLAPELFNEEYVFSAENILQNVQKDLSGNNLDVIVGVSLGGLVLPHIAKNFPKSKLIFVASGPYLKSEVPFFNFLIKILRSKLLLRIISLALYLPNSMLAFFYRIGSPFSGVEEMQKSYEDDMLKNINQIKSISPQEESEILDFVYKMDNTEILKTLDNPGLIFNGKKDLFMPEERGKTLQKLLVNSKLIINDEEHFNVFTEADLPEVEKFVVG